MILDISHTDFIINRILLILSLLTAPAVAYYIFKSKKIHAVLFEREVFGIAAKAVALDESPYKLIILNSYGKIVDVNNKIEKKFGYTDEELIENEAIILFANGGKKLIADYIEQFKDTLRINAEIETECLTKSGERFPARVNLVSKKIFNREIFCLIGIVDISREKNTLKECNEKIRLLNLGEEIGEYGSWYWNLETDQVLMSKGFKKIFEVEEDVCEANELMRYVFTEDRKNVQDKIEQCILNGLPYTVTYRKRNFNNETLDILCKGAPVKNTSGATIAVYGFIKIEDENGSTPEREL